MKVIPIQQAATAIVAPDTALLPPPGAPLFDRRGRSLRDLRISVTDRCNFRCVYCMPREVFGDDYAFLPRRELLSFEEVTRVASLFVARGVRKIRITGGEPLLRKDVDRLIEMLARQPGVEITLTTNGVLLPKLARRLKDAGLHRVTVSLDALDDALFRRMNDADYPVARVLEGIEAAKSAAPRLIACSRGEDAAISSTWAMPAADSMITSKAIFFLRPFAASIAVTSASTA